MLVPNETYRIYGRLRCVVIASMFACTAFAGAAQSIPDSTSKFKWQNLALGAGGWVVGVVTHPSAPGVVYCRTDVGNGYRWNAANGTWTPLRVVNRDGTGFPSSVITAPGPGGIQSIQVDPSDPSAVYIAAPNNHSGDIGGSSGINIYRSFDSGKTFRAGNLNVPGDPNDNWRFLGERLCVDPNNSKVIYFGTGFGPGTTTGSGVYRSLDRGATWTKVVTESVIGGADNIVNVLIDKRSGVTARPEFGSAVGKVSKSIWACGGHMASGRFWSDLFHSTDGGATWKNVSRDLALSGNVGRIFLDSESNLYAIQSGSKVLWKLSNQTWTKVATTVSDNLSGLAIDAKHPSRMFAICQDASVSRTLDGGQSWVNFGRLQYANKFSWLPQVPGNTQAWGYRSTGGIELDASGALWICQGNEGMLRYQPSEANLESTNRPPQWSICSKGIEELVTQDIIVPKGGGGRIYTAVADATGMVLTDPDSYTAAQIPLQTDLISQGSQVASCPNDPQTVVVSASNVYTHGKNESGISFDAGKTWSRFAGGLSYKEAGQSHDIQAGSIAVSRRGAWSAGSDHIVQLPVNNCVPIYSKDGGKTWKPTKSFPTQASGPEFLGTAGYQGFWIFALKQRMLYADPFVADKLYLKLVNSPGSLYVSTDGGENWTAQSNEGLPKNTHHGQLAVNSNVQDDIWFADGWEGASSHGLFHSSDGGKTFAKIPGISNAITLALGAGSGSPRDAAYSIYFYGKFDSDPNWGVFRSRNGGGTWDRIAYYPAGIVDQPTCMAASWDLDGEVFIGFGGNSYVYCKPKSPKGN